jgi:hypothetical protein
MTKRKATLIFALLASIVSCNPEPTPTGPPQEVPITNPVDGGAPTVSVQANTTEFCSIELLWNYTDRQVTFTNKNDKTARVFVYRVADDTLVVSNYLLADGKDAEDASFAVGDEVRVIVEFLDLNLSLDQWAECGRRTYVLGK